MESSKLGGSRPIGVEKETASSPEAETLLGDSVAASIVPTYYSKITSLPDGHPYIRLLHLGPAAEDDKDAPLLARLELVNLQNPHVRFEALSYVWGQAMKKGGIRLFCKAPNDDGYILTQADITVNLAVALKHLRRRDRTRILWVDAICINQNDVAEKTAQVGLMSYIYRQADRVLIWMGPAQHRSDWVLSHVNNLFEQAQAAEHSRQPADDTSTDQALEATPGTTPTVLSLSDTFAFARLLNREWYTRVWVTQELCVAKEAVVICGDSSAPWDALLPAFKSLDGSADAGEPSSALNYGIVRHMALCRLRLLTVAGNRLGLDEALIRCQWSRASSPVDKVYALLGISKDQGIIPDYSVSSEACFTLAATIILSRETVPDLLDFVTLPASTKRNKLLPSWVPDWSPQNVTAKTEIAQSLADAFRLEQLLYATETQDAPRGFFKAKFQGTSTLILRGIEIDTVELVNEPIPGPWLGNPISITAMDRRPTLEETSFMGHVTFLKASWKYVVHNFKFLATLVGKDIDYASTMAHIHELAVFTRQKLNPQSPLHTTPTGDVPANHPTAQLADLLICNTKALRRLSDLEATRALLPPLEMAARLVPRLYRALYLHKIFPSVIYHAVIALTGIYGLFVRKGDTYSSAIDSVNRLTPYIGMRMGLSRERKFLCLVPHGCCVGDRIVLVGGGRHPYVFRRVGTRDGEVDEGRWVLVGPCYVGGGKMDELGGLWVEEDARDMLVD